MKRLARFPDCADICPAGGDVCSTDCDSIRKIIVRRRRLDGHINRRAENADSANAATGVRSGEQFENSQRPSETKAAFLFACPSVKTHKMLNR